MEEEGREIEQDELIHYVQVAPATAEGRRWYTVAALPVSNVGLADWLADALRIDGQRATRVIDHDELLKIGGELEVEMAQNDLIALDPELLK
jgi:hypothetical protein